MKILHICNNFIGSKLYVQLFERLVELGLNLEVYVPIKNRRYHEVNKLENSKIRIYYPNIHSTLTKFSFTYKMWVSQRDIIKTINFQDIKLVHAHTLFSDGGLALRIKRQFGIKYIVAVRDTDLNVFLKYGLHLRHEATDILLEAEQIIFLNSNYKNSLLSKYVKRKYFQSIRRKCVVIPNGIDSFWLTNINKSRKPQPEGKSKILFVGQFLKRKNIDTVLDVYDYFLENGISIELTLAGKDSYASKNIIKRLSQPKYQAVNVIDRISSKSKLLNLYREHDIFFMPSYRETFGLVYLEALTQGLPVFFTKGQGIDGYFAGNYIGATCKANDFKGFFNAIYNPPKPIIDKIDFSSFDWSNISIKYKTLYEEIK
jgi:L-malate glycosyltransferase